MKVVITLLVFVTLVYQIEGGVLKLSDKEAENVAKMVEVFCTDTASPDAIKAAKACEAEGKKDTPKEYLALGKECLMKITGKDSFEKPALCYKNHPSAPQIAACFLDGMTKLAEKGLVVTPEQRVTMKRKVGGCLMKAAGF